MGAEEAFALDGLLSISRRRPILPGQRLQVSLSQFEAALESCGFDPRREYERVAGEPLRDLPAERDARRELRTEFRTWLDAHEVVRRSPAIAAWLDQAMRSGRVHPQLASIVRQALQVVDRLQVESSRPIQRTVLAAELIDGDPHALDVGTPLHELTVSLLAAAAHLNHDARPREVWAAWNVTVDPVSSNAAALDLPLLGNGAAVELAQHRSRNACDPHLRAVVTQ